MIQPRRMVLSRNSWNAPRSGRRRRTRSPARMQGAGDGPEPAAAMNVGIVAVVHS